MQMNLKTMVEREYGLTVKQIDKYKDVYRLQSREFGAMCLKPYDVDQAEVEYLAGVFAHLRMRGFRYGPEVYRTKNGIPWIKDGHLYFMLTNWVVGATPNFSSSKMIRKALSALAKFHLHADGLPAESVPDQRKHVHMLPNIVTLYKEALAESGLAYEFRPFMDLCDMALHHLGDERCKIALAQEEQAVAFSHGDYNFPNLVLREGAMHLIDFEASAHQTRMVDLSHILHRNYAWLGNSTLRSIEYYERKRPLNPETRYLLAALLHVPYPIVRELHRLKTSKNLPSQLQINNYVNYLQRLM